MELSDPTTSLVAREAETRRTIIDARKHFTTYRVVVDFRAKLMGGTPKDPKVIEGWLRAKAGAHKEDEKKHLIYRTLKELDLPVTEAMTFDELVEASKLVGDREVTGFKVGQADSACPGQLVLEGRQVKAGLREAVNIAFAGEKWGATRKGARNYLAERVFVVDEVIGLGRTEPDDVEQIIIHTTGPQGPKSALGYHEFCLRPTITFSVLSLQDCIKVEQWEAIFAELQEVGLGALRSQGHGTFNVVAFDRLEKPKATRAFVVGSLPAAPDPF